MCLHTVYPYNTHCTDLALSMCLHTVYPYNTHCTCPCVYTPGTSTTLTVLTWFCRHLSTHRVPLQRTLTARRPCLTESTRAISANRVRLTPTVVTLPLSELSTRRPSCSVYPLVVNPFSMISPHRVTAVRVTYSKPLSTHSLCNSSRRGHFHTSLKHQASVYNILRAKGAGK